ncbi:MAG: adenylate/guanylate cyclase domain-containing protein [Candidatus Riflebacteria bacterium]
MKKLFLGLMICLGLFLPLISISSIIKKAESNRKAESLQTIYSSMETELQLLGKTYEDSAWVMANLERLIKITDDGKIEKFLKILLPDFIRQIPFPIEIECLIQNENRNQIIRRLVFGKNLGLTRLRQAETELRHDQAGDKPDAGLITPENIDFMSLQYRNIEFYPRELILYGKDKTCLISRKGISQTISVVILADLRNVNLQETIAAKIIHFDRAGMGIGAMINSSKNTVFSGYFFDKPELKEFIENSTRRKIYERLQFDRFNHSIFLDRYDDKRKCRFFAVSRKNAHKRLPAFSMALALLGIFSCIIFKFIFEKFFLGRGRDFSIKALLPLIFLFLIILPIFVGAGFIGEFFQTGYSREKQLAAAKLSFDLNETDLQNRDVLRSIINHLRTINSMEDLEIFSNSSFHGEYGEFFCNFLDKYKLNGIEGVSLCFVPINGTAVKSNFNNEIQKHRLDEVDNPMTLLFVRRVEEMLKENEITVLRNKTGSGKMSQEFKLEMARDFFLKTVGSEGYYSFRKNNEPFFLVNSKYRNYYYLFKLILWKGMPHGYLVWELRKGNRAGNIFPLERLRLNHESTRLAFAGEYSSLLKSFRFDITSLRQKFPELVAIVEKSHLSRSRVIGRIETAKRTVIMEARPGNSSPEILAGSEMLDNYSTYSAKMAWQIARILVFLTIPGFFIAWAGALYFTYPLQKLTEATGQIHAGNFAFRVNSGHPDEFKDIADSFNAMARSLEEGEKLKSYVSGSVIREVTDSEGFTANRSEARHATIIFSSINGFKDFQSHHSATEVFALLQAHLQTADAAVSEFGGEIDKMIEDKVMIVFEHESDAQIVEKAIQIAEKITRDMLESTGAKISVGINSGLTIAGIMGAESARLSRTVVGDPVNLAARLAYVASQQPNGSIVISGHLKNLLPQGFSVETLPISHVKGKTQQVEACLVQKQK